MERFKRYLDIHAGSSGRRLSLDCFRRPPGSGIDKPMELAALAATAQVTVHTLDGATVLDRENAVISPDLAHRFDYVLRANDVAPGPHRVWWRVTIGSRVYQHGPFDLTVLESPFEGSAPSGVALVFSEENNSGLLAAI